MKVISGWNAGRLITSKSVFMVQNISRRTKKKKKKELEWITNVEITGTGGRKIETGVISRARCDEGSQNWDFFFYLHKDGMMMWIVGDDPIMVCVCLKLLDRAEDHAYCHNYAGVNRAKEQGTCVVVQVISAIPLKMNWSGWSSAVWSQPSLCDHSHPKPG